MDKIYNPWPDYCFSGEIRPWPMIKFTTIPSHILKPDYAHHVDHISLLEENHNIKKTLNILTQDEIEKMRTVCRLAREVMDKVAEFVKVGITGEDIDELVTSLSIERNSYPSPLLYYGFPKSVCTSVNEVVCHGIPDTRPLKDGDILNVDITLYHDGFHGDLNETFLIGDVSDSKKKLVQVTHECMQKAIQIVKPGVPYKLIGEIIENHATQNGYSVVREYTGHGIHRLFHCEPVVYHRKNKCKHIMEAGHTFTIEPMINMGTHHVREWPDDWTVVTKDGKCSAQFEQTILVTDDGHEILTARKDHPNTPYFLD